MRKAYFVLDTVDENGKYFTVVCPITIEFDDVLHKLNKWSGKHEIKSCLLAESKKHATEIWANWKETHKLNNEYIDELQF